MVEPGAKLAGSLGKWRRLLLELSAFTVAHTVTLGLGALKILRVAPGVVEPLIAFSIAAVALEYLLGFQRSLLRFALVALFGLVHGLGFAGALLDLGFSGRAFLVFLAAFNLGVECGQLLVVTVTLAAFGLLARWPPVANKMALRIEIAIAACGVIVGTLRLLS